MKKSTLKLLGLLAILIAIYFVVEYTQSRSRSRSFRSELVDIDTASIDKLRISRSGEELVIERSGGKWRLNLANGKKVSATSSSVSGLLNSLQGIRPSRLAAKDEEKWKDYQVDSAGTRVEVFEGNKKSLDLVVGRLNVEGQRQFSTFVRLFDEPEVYSASNFMGASLTTKPTTFRNQQLARFTRDSVSQVSFNYPDSAFTLSRTDGRWMLGNEPADSAKTVSYLQSMAYLSNRNFDDDFDPAGSPEGSPALSVSFQLKGANPIKIEGYLPDGELVVHSDFNQEAWFRDSTLMNKIFKGPAHFRKNELE